MRFCGGVQIGVTVSSIAAVSASMAVYLLPVVGYGAAAVVHLVVLAAVVSVVSGNLVLHRRAVFMHTAMLVLG